MEIEKTIDTEDIKTRKADHRGRINLGTDYADREVEVLVVDAEDREEQPAN